MYFINDKGLNDNEITNARRKVSFHGLFLY